MYIVFDWTFWLRRWSSRWIPLTHKYVTTHFPGLVNALQ
jgi:hypothetical protein